MGQLKEIPFDVEYRKGQASSLLSKDGKHNATVTRVPAIDSNTEIIRVRCSCDSSWTMKHKATNEDIEKVFGAHLSYFDKPATQVL